MFDPTVRLGIPTTGNVFYCCSYSIVLYKDQTYRTSRQIMYLCFSSGRQSDRHMASLTVQIHFHNTKVKRGVGWGKVNIFLDVSTAIATCTDVYIYTGLSVGLLFLLKIVGHKNDSSTTRVTPTCINHLHSSNSCFLANEF